jgi:hypothetical protein
MNGISLSEAFFNDCVAPLVTKSQSGDLAAFSAAILGDGSEVLGYDDEISQDHNFSPRVLLFLEDEAYDRFGPALLADLRKSLPASYRGHALLWSEHRRALDVVPLHRFFHQYLDLHGLPHTTVEWLRCEEQRLLELTAGKVFHDPGGRLGQIRQRLRFFPPDVRLFLLRLAFMRLSECAGAERCIQRGDRLALHAHNAYFTFFAIKTTHLIERRYCPYHKWMARSLLDLEPFGTEVHRTLLVLTNAPTLDAIRDAMLAVLQLLGTRITDELGLPPPRVGATDGLRLLAFDWDAVIHPLSDRIPDTLRHLSPLISPAGYSGQIFDYSGYGSTYRELLEQNWLFWQPRRGPDL